MAYFKNKHHIPFRNKSFQKNVLQSSSCSLTARMNLSPKKVFLNIMEIENLVSIKPQRRKLSFTEVMLRFMHSFSTVLTLQCRVFKFECQWKIPFWKLWKLASFSQEKNIWSFHTFLSSLSDLHSQPLSGFV